MEYIDIPQALLELNRDYSTETEELQVFLSKQFWTSADKQTLLNALSTLLLNEKCTLRVAELFSPLLLDILKRCATVEADHDQSLTVHEEFCIALSKLVWLYSDAAKYAYTYFEESRDIFVRYETNDEAPPAKKKNNNGAKYLTRPLIEAALLFLSYDVKYFRQIWDWSPLVHFIRNEDINVRWLAYHCLSRIGHIGSQQLNAILLDNFGESNTLELTSKHWQIFSPLCGYDSLNQCRLSHVDDYDDDEEEDDDGGNARDFKLSKIISDIDLSPGIVNIFGVLLNTVSDDHQTVEDGDLVLVGSVQQSIYELALATSSGSAALIQGPVGCGKTSLVEYLAQITGRKPSKDLLKVQLGDQMDSKLLMGSHCCTDVPGEFVWQAGILTQAMTGGHWLLLEDIDCAPMDVISLLIPVLQSKSLVLPGHANPIKAEAGFHLFATQRLLKGFGGNYLEFKSNAAILDKLWRKIAVEHLSKEELKEVISKKWHVLQPIIDRILAVYSFFCPGIFDEDFDDENALPPSAYDRLISTRDLFKFCKRIARNFDIESSETATNTFQNGLECFCDSLPNVDDRVQAAESLGIKFGIPKTRAVYYCKQHKPNIEVTPNTIKIGRVVLARKVDDVITFTRPSNIAFAETRQAVSLLEKIAVAVGEKEPVLLVGETGTGKTSVIQYLAHMTNNRLSVINMNQQSDSIDLLGGYKPVDLRLIVAPLREEFEKIFPETFSRKQNIKFLGHIRKCFGSKRWEALFALLSHSQKAAIKRFSERACSPAESKLLKRWKQLGHKIKQLKIQLQQSSSPLAFTFVEGTLVKAMKNGDWILLDEINLAEAETLECLSGVLENDGGSLVLLERGDKESIRRHPDFRIFACMNPATDVGKKDLPVGIRNRFTEFFMEELEDKMDLLTLVESYLKGLTLPPFVIQNIVDFYLYVRKAAFKSLNDGTGHHPHYSLRTLCRALSYASKNPCECVPRSLYEAFCLSFLSQLDCTSHPIVNDAIIKYLLGKKQLPVLKQSIAEPKSGNHVPIQGYWIPSGDREPLITGNYILTKSVQRNLHDLARIVTAGKYPVLLQGETSVGKTSLVQWLAQATGNYCVRVNNHEHTDIQEYVGSYCADSNGKLVFKEGVLVEAMRNGFWIILDELNLAPTEVMEALNRVLDDNRELYITEIQETVKAHPKFMVFATQNPPGLYGGRKVLSRAFRNRFIELHFDEIPSSELEVILQKKCLIPPTYSKQMVAVMQELQLRRRESGIFAGKQGFITLRDLFRWGDRYQLADKQESTFYDWSQHLADEGYLLLAGRVRRIEECQLIQEVIEKHIKRKVEPEKLFALNDCSLTTAEILNKITESSLSSNFRHIVWTYNMRRLAVLVGKAIHFKEPVLLVGDTGCGKTTMCQLFSELYDRKLFTVNCHLHTESADFLGGLRPVRSGNEDTHKLFDWVDGPLVVSMEDGDFFLADEISLADDSVLERLNSVLEPERTVRVTEKGGSDEENTVVIAKDEFRILATMNPGGDYGKKELSPALRNRFTEIWCPSNLNFTDLVAIVESNITEGAVLSSCMENKSGFGWAIVEFLMWFLDTELGRRITVSIRDILTWVDFINVTVQDGMTDSGLKRLTAGEAYIHGACLVFLDSLGSSATNFGHKDRICEIKRLSYEYLIEKVESTGVDLSRLKEDLLCNWQSPIYPVKVKFDEKYFSIGPFCIETGPYSAFDITGDYNLEAPTVKSNATAILRAMQLSKPILLEGSPGVGKTSLVTKLARASGHQVVRINLSEQTDISDLYGADLPIDGGESGQFAWRDGLLLQALKAGHWILLDELNLASQSVLEGLNACLDHRGEVFVPELGETFQINRTSTRIFGCQNPHKEGGSRKGLPRSFLNRFIQVFVQPLTTTDFEFIVSAMFPMIPSSIICNMAAFNKEIVKQVIEDRKWGHDGYPWEFNLRDIFRWCEVMVADQREGQFNPGEYVSLIYADRMRTSEDKNQIYSIYENIFHSHPLHKDHLMQFTVSENSVQLGYSFLPRQKNNEALSSRVLCPLHYQMFPLESLMKCIEMQWMTILVGPPASGKSSIVHFLADLTGHTLKVLSVNSEMDTTELLGGFEQADVNRHIDYIIQELEPIINNAICCCLVRASDDCLQWIEYLLSHISTLYKPKKTSLSVAKELLACRQRVTSVLKAISLLGKLPFDKIDAAAIAILTQRTEKIRERLGVTCVVGSGGRFEWIDSILVHAVEKGHWLLIEDANFCSPSVLDRLNALLEPNGTLTIAEQGVVSEEIRQIYPHPEFRIILTMDPKNGEISRPMRNRGIEISLKESIDFEKKVDVTCDLWDVLMLAHCRYLTDSQMIYQLLKIHQALCFEGIEVPTSYDFLNVITLCVQSLQKYKSPEASLWHSCQMVYLKSILNSSARLKSDQLIRTTLTTFPDLQQGLKFHNSSWLELLPSSLDFQHNYVQATIKQQGFLFSYLLKYLSDVISDEPQEEGSLQLHVPYPLKPMPSLSNTKQWVKIFIFAIRFMFDCCSVSQWKVLCVWMEANLDQFFKDGPEDSKEHAYIQELFTFIRNFKQTILDNFLVIVPVAKDIISTMDGIADYFPGIDKDEIPVDPRWNFFLWRKLLQQLEKNQSECNVDQIERRVTSLSNRFLLLLNLSTLQFLKKDSTIMKHNSKYASLYEQSESFVNSETSGEELLHPVIAFIYPFFKMSYDAITNQLEESANSSDDDFWDYSDDDFWDVWKSFYVYYHFLEFCCEPIFKEQSMEELLDMFELHWTWMKKKINILFQTDDGQISIPRGLSAIMKNIEDALGNENYEVIKVRSKLLSILFCPFALQSQQEADLYKDILIISEHINMYEIMKAPGRIEDLKIVLGNGEKWNQSLINTFSKCFGKLSEKQNGLFEVISSTHEIKLQLIEANLLVNDDDEIMEVCRNPPIPAAITQNQLALHMQLLPLWDYLFVLTESDFISQASDLVEQLSTTDEVSKSFPFQSVPMEFLIDVGINRLKLDPVHIGQLISLHQGDITNMFTASLVSFFDHIRSGPSSGDLVACLTWMNKSNEDQDLKFEAWYANQSPVLTFICHNIFGGLNSSLDSTLSLGNYFDKMRQIENVKKLLWKNFEQLHNKDLVFRNEATLIIMSWYKSLIRALCKLANIPLTTIYMSSEELFDIMDKLELTKKLQIMENVNILLLASNSILDLKNVFENGTIDPLELQWSIGKSFALVGILTVLLFAPMDLVDPIQKLAMKIKCAESELSDAYMEFSLREWYAQAITGQYVSNPKQDSHPYILGLRNMGTNTKIKKQQRQRELGYRPTPSQFNQLRGQIQKYINSHGSPGTIHNFVMEFEKIKQLSIIGDLKFSEVSKFIVRIENWKKNHITFIHGLKSEFPLYRDLTHPFLVGAEQLLMGIQMMSHFVSTLQLRNDFPTKVHNLSDIEIFCTRISSFPLGESRDFTTPLELAAFLVHSDTIADIEYLSQFLHPSGNNQTVTLKLMKSALMEMTNEAIVFGQHSMKKVLNLAIPILNCFCEMWKRQENELKMKKEQLDSMYEHRTHTFEAEMSEEKSIAQEVNSMFPSYQEEFAEFRPICLDDDDSKAEEPVPLEISSMSLLTNEEMLEVWSSHATLVSLLPSSISDIVVDSEIVIKASKEPDYAKPFFLRYEVLQSVMLAIGDKLDSSLDKHFVPAHLLAAAHIQALSKLESGGPTILMDQYYDIYHDPNHQEVLQCKPLLDNLASRLTSILKEFPENPLLLQILNIVRRIQSFAVDSPLMKFVTGMELVLASAQIWEQNAHAKVTLQCELEKIAHKVIHCRKLELQCWRQCLNNVMKKQYSSCAKWWFHIYYLLTDVLDTTEHNQPDFDKVKWKNYKLNMTVKVLQQFLEDSSLGQYAARLGLLQTFLQHLQISPPSYPQKKTTAALFNIFMFYKQFLPLVTEKIAELRRPIEKEVKEFVKISRWNDINFYSLKQAVEKSHRTIHKLTKSFEKLLEQPARSTFCLPSKKDANECETAPWSLNIDAKKFFPPKDRQLSTELDNVMSDTVFDKLPHYCRKGPKLCRKIVNSFIVLNHINTLNEFSGGIIETLQELDEMDTKKNDDKDHKKKEAKLIQISKRRALANLFKALGDMGLSYRQGLIYCSNRNENDALFVPALSAKLLKPLEADSLSGTMLATSWSGMNHYYYKCVGQFSTLLKSLESPSKELTIDAIHKCHGFAGHLMEFVILQRRQIAGEIKNINNFSNSVKSLQMLSSEDRNKQKSLAKQSPVRIVCPPQIFVLKWKGVLCNLLIETVVTLQQFLVLMNCCPNPNEEVPETYQHANVSSSFSIDKLFQGNSLWVHIVSSVEQYLGQAKHIIATLLPTVEATNAFHTWEQFTTIKECFKVLFNITKDVSLFVKEICHDNGEQITTSLRSLCSSVELQWEEFAVDAEDMCSRSYMSELCAETSVVELKEQEDSDIINISEKLLTKVLLSVQDMVTFSVEEQDNSHFDDSEIEHIPSKLFTKRIGAYLSESKKLLRIRMVSILTKKLIKHIREFENNSEEPLLFHSSLRYAINIVPILIQYDQLTKLYLVAAFGMHRTSCKLLSILLNVFNDLAEKGFCLPPELQDEIAQSGATEFHDIQEGGLGDGEGVKDVSENITSEDQLDDTMKEGESQKEETESPDLKDEKQGIEMSEDFEGKTYDPDSDNSDNDDDDDDQNDSDTELEKKMGSVDESNTEKLDDQIWGSDSENEEEENNKEDEGDEGMTENKASELAAKDDKQRDYDDQKKKDKEPEDACPDLKNEGEYDGEHVDPLIDAPPLLEPEVIDLPEKMELDKDSEDTQCLEDEDDEKNELEIDTVKDSAETLSEDGDDQEEHKEEKEEGFGNLEQDSMEVDEEIEKSDEKVPDDENKNQFDVPEENPAEEKAFPTQETTSAPEALPADDPTKESSKDIVEADVEGMDWQGGMQQTEDQHKEGQADAENSHDQDTGHEGKKVSAPQSKSAEQKKHHQSLKQPSENRTLGASVETPPELLPVAERKTKQKPDLDETENQADLYEHVQEAKESDRQTADIATEDQALEQPVPSQKRAAEEAGGGDDDDDDNDDVIALDSSSEEDDAQPMKRAKMSGDTTSKDKDRKAGKSGELEHSSDEMEEDLQGDIVVTQGSSRGPEASIHTQHDLWSALSIPHVKELREKMEMKLKLVSHDNPNHRDDTAQKIWQECEIIVSPLVQELCEQLRLVLEPTKMSKLKGDYRTGKRLNMRKVIPYIASQFRKDKIWLRRTKPSKRQYQIMLAVDDSSSMADNHSKQLAFEALALLGKSLSFIEAGELSIVSFGENVTPLHDFGETFTSSDGARILEEFTFSQTKTRIGQLVDYATDAMIMAGNSVQSKLISKEIAQLLIIISDGRGVRAEGEKVVQQAVRRARSNNVFMVFLVLDSPLNKDSILDIMCPVFELDELKEMKPYMERFPFPFYILLRDITSLPQVLGEALRQWFELVTSVER